MTLPSPIASSDPVSENDLETMIDDAQKLPGVAETIALMEAISADRRAKTAGLDPGMTLDRWDDTANITYDRAVWNELCSPSRTSSETVPLREQRPPEVQVDGR